MSRKIKKTKLDKITNKKLLFKRSFLVTSNKQKDLSTAPFYNNFDEFYVNEDMFFYKNKYINGFVIENDKNYIVLFGHAYNPIKKIDNEEDLLKWLLDDLNDFNKTINKINELSGVFALFIKSKKKYYAVQDATGMMPIAYGLINNEKYFTSHVQIVADILNLEIDPIMEEYLLSKFNKIGLSNLPGIKTVYSEMKTLTANTFLDITDLKIERFYPIIEIEKKKVTLEEIAEYYKNSIDIIAKRWNSVISLTGGLDSKITLASSVNSKNEISYYSFSSNDNEQIDLEAAEEILTKLNRKHHQYKIPLNLKEKEHEEFEEFANIMRHNLSYTRYKYGSDVYKRFHLYKNFKFEMEVKSFVNEITRTYFYHKMGMKKFKFPLTARNLSNFTKRNMFNRKLLKKMDEYSQEYIDKTEFMKIANGYDPTDLFYWEFRNSQWASFTRQSFDLSNDTTYIFNNRFIMDELLKYDFNDRFTEKLHYDLIKVLDKEVYNINVRNKNISSGKFRKIIEHIFFKINNF